MTGTKPNNDRDRRCDRDAAPDYRPQVETWAEAHRMMGHYPHSAPTTENPERWDCDCGYLWRILTGEQIRQKFAHSKHRTWTP